MTCHVPFYMCKSRGLHIFKAILLRKGLSPICIPNLTHELEVLFPPFNHRLKFLRGFWAVVVFEARKTSDELLPLGQRVKLGWMSIGDG